MEKKGNVGTHPDTDTKQILYIHPSRKYLVGISHGENGIEGITTNRILTLPT